MIFAQLDCAWLLHKGQIGLNSRSQTWFLHNLAGHDFLHKGRIGLNSRSKVTDMIFFCTTWPCVFLRKGQNGLNCRSKLKGHRYDFYARAKLDWTLGQSPKPPKNPKPHLPCPKRQIKSPFYHATSQNNPYIAQTRPKHSHFCMSSPKIMPQRSNWTELKVKGHGQNPKSEIWNPKSQIPNHPKHVLFITQHPKTTPTNTKPYQNKATFARALPKYVWRHVNIRPALNYLAYLAQSLPKLPKFLKTSETRSSWSRN